MSKVYSHTFFSQKLRETNEFSSTRTLKLFSRNFFMRIYFYFLHTVFSFPWNFESLSSEVWPLHGLKNKMARHVRNSTYAHMPRGGAHFLLRKEAVFVR